MEQIEKIQGTEKEFIKVFQELCYSRSSWQVWADLMAAMACTLANSVDKTEPRYTAREKEYAECIKRLGGVEKPAKCFAIVVEALERNPDQDFLGKLYMSLELGKGLILRVPRDTQEIKNEGAALHHCVGTYVDRVAKGQTHIFFVRRVEEPDTPYFTMEYNNGRVIQCRGNHNCGMPASVKAFVAAFEKLMKEREEKQELKIKQMTTDIADMIEKDTAVPQGNDGIF